VTRAAGCLLQVVGALPPILPYIYASLLQRQIHPRPSQTTSRPEDKNPGHPVTAWPAWERPQSHTTAVS
jgi:hypothetical protein